jgi:hypothetical protein
MIIQADIWGNNSGWFWSFLQFVFVGVTLFLIYIQVRVQTASHVVQAMTTIMSRWNSEALLRARRRVCQQWLSGNREFDGVSIFVADFMEELGIYLRIRAVPVREMWEAQSWYIEHYYWMFHPGMIQSRKDTKDQNLYTQFESLYGRMNDLNRKHRSPTFERGEQELRVFAESEVAVAESVISLNTSP